MKRFSFNTFLAADGNRAALDICTRIADLEPVAPMPVLLLGEEGCGKTHLLYSIWKRVKASSPRTSLAVVTAREFRREIRDLIAEPSPVEKAESAILLIDQLELFDDLLEELEAVVRIFLDNHHHVMLASNVHPRRLKALPQGLRDMLAAGQTIEIRLREGETQIEIVKRELRRESQDMIEKQRIEIDRLRGLLERVGAAGTENGESAGLRQALEAERRQNAELTRQLEVAQQFGHSLQEEMDSVRSRLQAVGGNEELGEPVSAEELAQLRETIAGLEAELAEARTETESLRRELERRGDTEEEVEHFREALEAAQSEKNRILSEAVTERDNERRRHEEETGLLAQQLETARQEAAQARHEANLLVERAEKLVSQIEGNQTRFRETEQEQRRQIEELEALLAMRGPVDEQNLRIADLEQQLATAESRIEATKQEYEHQRRELAERLARSEEHIQVELSRARESAQQAQRALDEAGLERDQLREALSAADTEREALRAAMGDLEEERNRLEASLIEERGAREVLEAALQELRTGQENFESALNESQMERDGLREALEAAQREGHDLQTALDEARNQLETLQEQVQQAEARLREQAAEMEALRHDAAAQVAQANAQAGELEGRLGQLQARYARATEIRHDIARRVGDMRANLTGSVDTLGEFCARLLAVEEDTQGPETEADDASWEPSAPPPEHTAENREASREAPSMTGSEEDDQFDDDRMVLPPAPDEEDIDPAASEAPDTGSPPQAWSGPEAPGAFGLPETPGAFGLPETPMAPLQDLTPLEDERE